MRYYKATMDYRKFSDKSPKYYEKLGDEVGILGAKKYFRDKYSWLKLYKCEEITKDEYDAYIDRIRKLIYKGEKYES